MSVNIVVKGLPGNVRFTKLLTSFRMLFKRAHIRQFWIRNLSDDGQFKEALVEVPSHSDAIKALDFLNSVPFRHNMMEFPMEAYTSEESPLFYNENDCEDWGRSGSGSKRKLKRRARSRSPRYSRQSMHTSDLDMEIKLLKKQRQVLEEERLLLIEQKRLEMLKENDSTLSKLREKRVFVELRGCNVLMAEGPLSLTVNTEIGPSVSLDVLNFRPDLKDSRRPGRQTEPVPKRPRQKSPPPKISPKVPKQPSLPLFFQPCKKLVGQMRPIIERDASPEEVDILIKIIRAAIRRDLALALDDKDYMKHADIINLYRERHPQEQDEAFIAKILANIRASSVYLTEGEGAVKGKNVANDTETLVNVKGEGKTQEYGNATDVAVNEPATSQESGNLVECSEVIQPEMDFTADVIADAADEIKKESELLGDDEKSADWIEEQ